MNRAVGEQGPDWSFGPVTLQDLVRYAGASGDFQPIHFDEDYARAGGLASVIAHGMLSMGLLGSYLTSWFGSGAVRRYGVRFREQVVPGDTLRAEGRIASITRHEGELRAEVQVALLRQTGAVAVSGTAVVALGGA